MKYAWMGIVIALLAAGCASPDAADQVPAAPAAEQTLTEEEAARQEAERQGAALAQAEQARELARQQQAAREAEQALLAEQARIEAEQREVEKAEAAKAEAALAEAERVAEEARKKEAADAAAKAATEKAVADANSKETSMPAGTDVVAEIETTAGTMVLGFFPDVAPGHVKNFTDLAAKGFYDGTRFHRTISGFMIQGGDPFSKDTAKQTQWGSGDPGYKIKAEFNSRPHLRGTLSMARGQNHDSAGSQFFICHEPQPRLDQLKYTVFGELLRGYDVLDRIADAPVGMSAGGERSRPLNPVQIVKITLRPRTPADVKEGS